MLCAFCYFPVAGLWAAQGIRGKAKSNAANMLLYYTSCSHPSNDPHQFEQHVLTVHGWKIRNENELSTEHRRHGGAGIVCVVLVFMCLMAELPGGSVYGCDKKMLS